MTAAVHLILRVMSLIGIGYWTVVLARRSERWRVLVTGHWMLMFLLSVAWPGKRDPLWMTVYALALAVLAHVVPLYDKRRLSPPQKERMIQVYIEIFRRDFPWLTDAQIRPLAERNYEWDVQGGTEWSREDLIRQGRELGEMIPPPPRDWEVDR